MSDTPSGGNRDRARRYTPLVVTATSLVIALFGLPSVLNLPQANPGQVAEYAPVPPDDETQNPPGGNFAGLGLGGTSTVGEPGGEPPAPGGGGSGPFTGQARSKYRCVIVNGAPHQTEDPLSPPCVSSFEGDNGGATYAGVTKKEIRVVVYIACGGQNLYSPTSRGQESAPCGQVDDIDDPPAEDDFLFTRALKRYQVYFNSRYQTYGRRVHLWAKYSHTVTSAVGPGGCREDCRRTDASETFEDQKPFAVITANGGAFMEFYVDAMARKRVLNFGGTVKSQSYFRRFPGMIWSYEPSLEEQANLYASAVCRQLAPEKVSFSGQPADQGKKRKFGVIFSNGEEEPYYEAIKKLVVKELKGCGVATPPEHGYVDGGCSISCDPAMGPTHATELQDLRQQGVTTILWIGAQSGEWSRQAENIDWRPEWVIFGDGAQEDFVTGRYQEQAAAEHMWVVSNVTKVGRPDDELCALAIREVDPNFPSGDVVWACDYYNDLRQLFTGIQVAGPRIKPETIDQGFHSIPAIASTDPRVPACFYRPGDYTCVKDAIAMWWDPDAQIRGWSGNGCWKMVDGGKRSLASGWPQRNLSAGKKSSDVCNGYTSNSSFNPYQQP